MNNHHSSSYCELLEARTFFSLTPAQAVAADKVKISTDKAVLNSDRTHYTQAISADRKLLVSDTSAALTTAGNSIKADASREKQALAADQKNGAARLAGDRATILNDRKAVTANKHNPAAEANAMETLQSDQSILTADNAAFKTTLANDRSAFSTRLKTDTANLNSIRKGGTQTTASDRNQLSSDLKSSSSAITMDLKALGSDEYQLLKDQAAEAASNLLNIF